jgi:membrane-bound lytic murein transglycosylase A
MRLNYVATNGYPYTPVGRFLVERGIVAKEDMSMDRIREWMEANPDEATALRRKNRSFVFFQETALPANEESIGAQGVPLTPLRSVAVDKNIHVYGTPIWIDAKLPIASEKPETPFRHLAVAQDTGTAIVGPARADIYFGSGEAIGHVAGRIKQHGTFVMLVPNSVTINASAKP